MHIENIKISNFRIFSHRLIVENFTPGINVFIGPNGSGKSSFFQAFQLLLSGKALELKNEFNERKLFWNVDKKSDFFFIQITLNNSKKNIQIKKERLVIKRLISQKVDKLWISEYCLEKKKIDEFFSSNGLVPYDFFFFLTSTNNLELKLSDSYKFFEFFIKNSELSRFSYYFSKISLMLKKTIILKGKLSKLLKILLKKQEMKINQKNKDLKISKINYYFIALENNFSGFEVKLLVKLKKNLFLTSFKFLLKIIYLKNKINGIKEFFYGSNYKKHLKNQFFKKKKLHCIFGINLKMEISKKKKFFFKLETYTSKTISFFSSFFWAKSVFRQIGNLLFRNILISSLNVLQNHLSSNGYINLNQILKNHFNSEKIKNLNITKYITLVGSKKTYQIQNPDSRIIPTLFSPEIFFNANKKFCVH